MVTDKDHALAASTQAGEVSIEDHLSKRVHGGQPARVDKYLIHIRAIASQRIDQFVGRGTIKLSIEGKVHTVFVLELKDVKVH
jgi:hypothetical protein